MDSLLMKIIFIFVILITEFFWFDAHGFVKDPIYDDLEGYELVKVLIRDGKLDLAKEELHKKDVQNNDPQKYHLLNGDWYYAKGEWKKAIEQYSKTPDLPEAKVHLARVYYQEKSYADCEKSYSRISVQELLSESDYLWKSYCNFKVNKVDIAFRTLQAARSKFASFAVETDFIALNVNAKLSHLGFTHAVSWLQTHSALATQYLNLAEIFHNAGEETLALAIVELGLARFPTHRDLNLTLSQMYFQKNLLQASEEGFARAALTDKKYYYHTAELNRQLGRYERSQYFNGFVSDPKEKLKQKIATYVDAGKYPLIASLDSVIQRSGLQNDLQNGDEIRYALAYSLVKMGQTEKPLEYLAKITRPELLEKTTILRKTLLDCQERNTQCKL